MAIKWTSDLSVGVAEIDQQHKKLFGMVDELNTAMAQGKSKEVLRDTINGLIRYTSTHFKQEETYFAKFGYPDTAAHKNEHINFVQKVKEFRDGYVSGQMGLSISIMTFLTDWLKNHIKVSDKKYEAFFNKNGLR